MQSWSEEQLSAVERVTQWLKTPFSEGLSLEPGVFRLFGHAGSGKTSLARHLAETASGVARYAAFTGKAALVMQQKGCMGATTIHRLIYLPRVKCQQRLRELVEKLRTEKDPDRLREFQIEHDVEKSNLARPAFTLNTASSLRDASLLVIDECSMIGENIGKDLIAFEVPILALGDPAQLPPVKDRGYFTDPRGVCDAFLVAVHRQAAGSPVLELATHVRGGASLGYGDYGQGTRVVRRKDLSIAEAVDDHDQIIVGRNSTRRAINARARQHLGYPPDPLPVPGDRLVCLRNDYETGLLNGGQWRCLGAERLDGDRAVLSIVDDDGQGLQVEAHLHYFRGEAPPFYEVREAQCFDWSYAITAHKAQGSQFPAVCVVDESAAFGADAHRWAYTAITRASERVTVVR